MVTIERMIVFTVLVLVSLAWINPVRFETKTSVVDGVVSSTTTITVDYDDDETPSAAP